MIAGVIDFTGRKAHQGRLLTLAQGCHPPLELRALGPAVVAASATAFGAPSERILCAVDGRVDEPPDRRVDIDPSDPSAAFRCFSNGAWRAPRGAYAAVVWDEHSGRGALLRDPMGVRPLFAVHSRGALVFASELRDLLALLPQRPLPDPAAVVDLLGDAPAEDRRTLYEGVAPVPAGSGLSLGRHDWRALPAWAPTYRSPEPLGMTQAAERMGALLTRLIARDTRGARTSVMLSGGLDSSSVAALATAVHGGRTLGAFSLVFPDHPATDEEQLILAIARALDIPSTRAAVSDGSPLAQALRFLDAWGTPPQTMNGFILAPLQRAARDVGVEVMLDGEGGDELFELSPWLVADLLRGGSGQRAFEMTRRIRGADSQRPRALLRYLAATTLTVTVPRRVLGKLRRPHRYFKSPPRWLADVHRDRLLADDDPFAWRVLDGPSWWAQQAHLLTRQRQQLGYHDLLRRQLAMQDLVGAHPLLDLDAVELVLSLPPELAFDPHASRPLLRAIGAGRVPDEVRLRATKSYFDPVLEHCFPRHDLELCRRLLSSRDAETAAFVDTRRVEELFGSWAPGQPARLGDIWRLTMAELWLRTQGDPSLPARLLEQAQLPAATIDWRGGFD